MPVADGGHKEDVAVKEFDAVVFVENADLAELVIFLDGESVGFGGGHAHGAESGSVAAVLQARVCAGMLRARDSFPPHPQE